MCSARFMISCKSKNDGGGLEGGEFYVCLSVNGGDSSIYKKKRKRKKKWRTCCVFFVEGVPLLGVCLSSEGSRNLDMGLAGDDGLFIYKIGANLTPTVYTNQPTYLNVNGVLTD